MDFDLSLPFNAVDGDRTHNAEDLARLFACLMTDGVHPSPGSSLAVTAAGGFNVSVAAGRCIAQGRVGVNDSAKTLAVDPPDGAYDRVDRVVVRVDYQARAVQLQVKRGNASLNPVPPALTRSAAVYELGLATVAVSAEAASLSQSDITDTRRDESVCGVMNSLIRADTAGLFAQYDEIWRQWKDASESAFALWFARMRDLAQEAEDGVNAPLSWAQSTLQTKSITDDDGFFESDTVEGALQEIGALLEGLADALEVLT